MEIIKILGWWPIVSFAIIIIIIILATIISIKENRKK